MPLNEPHTLSKVFLRVGIRAHIYTSYAGPTRSYLKPGLPSLPVSTTHRQTTERETSAAIARIYAMHAMQLTI